MSRWRLLERKKNSKSNQTANELSPRTAPIEQQVSPLPNHPLEPPASVPEAAWPPYYPPEAYSILTEETRTNGGSFKPSTPPPLIIPDPAVAPFQFSSSSLSAALTDPPPRPRPLPPVSVYNTPELSQYTLHDMDDQPTLSPLAHINIIPDMHDISTTFNPSAPSIYLDSPLDSHLSELPISHAPYGQDSLYTGLPFADSTFPFVSPIHIPQEIPQSGSFFEMWKPRYQEEFEFDSPRSVIDGLGFGDFNEGFSSSSSTPFLTSHTLSPSASPNPIVFSDLPSADLSPSGGSSLLFSTGDGQNSGVQRSNRSISARKHKPCIKLPVPTRLSSSLPFTNE